MNRLFHTCKQLIGIAALSVELYACDWIHDDSLPLCEFRLYFKYDYNMKFADAFQHEVDFVTLFVCDQEGNFLFQRRIEKSELDERNSIAFDMEPGTYQVVTWAGLDKGSYAWNDPAETSQAVERAQGVKVRTLREDDTTQPNELHPLWHSLDTFTVTRDMPEADTISLAKNTNKLRVVLQNVMGEDMDVNNFSFRIVADNGYMDYDNSLLQDPTIHYLPYYTENVELGADPTPGATVGGQYVAVAEMNTMRLMAGRNYPQLGPYRPPHHPSSRMGEGCAEREPQRLPPSHQDGGAPYLPAGVSGPAGRVFYHLLPYTEGMPRLSG